MYTDRAQKSAHYAALQRFLAFFVAKSAVAKRSGGSGALTLQKKKSVSATTK
jgi:hypothetical protein